MTNEIATVFYVDDNLKSRRWLGSVLTECGFKIITADPADALLRCQSLSFDLALLDYQTPSLNGTQLAEEIKFFVPDVPIVLISGHATLPAQDLAFVDAHFGRGTSLDDLVDTMRRLTNSKPPIRISPRFAAAWSHST